MTIHLPTQTLTEYNAATEGRVYLFTGNKVTSRFCVARKRLLRPSKLGHILTDNQALQNYQIAEGKFIKYKSRSYCWENISENGVIQSSQQIMDFLNLKVKMELLSIRSSDISFTMGTTDIKQSRKRTFYQHFRDSIRYSNSACSLFVLTIFV